MSDEPFIRCGSIQIALEVDDWAKADGAMLTPDGEVVPMMDLGPGSVVKLDIDPKALRKLDPDIELDDSVLIDAQKTAHQSRKAADAL